MGDVLVTDIQGQVFLLLVLVASGISLGIVLDFFRVIRNNRKIPKIVKLCLDILLLIFIFLLTSNVLLAVNWGVIRVYVFLFIGIGVAAYYIWISSNVMSGYVVLFCFSGKIVQAIEETVHSLKVLFYKLVKKE